MVQAPFFLPTGTVMLVLPGSRWNRHAITRRDIGLKMTLALDGSGNIEMTVGGVLRTRIERSWGVNRYSQGWYGKRGGVCTCPDGTKWLVAVVHGEHCTDDSLRCFGGGTGTCTGDGVLTEDDVRAYVCPAKQTMRDHLLNCSLMFPPHGCYVLIFSFSIFFPSPFPKFSWESRC